MVCVGGILGVVLLSAIHGGTVINTIYQDGSLYTPYVPSHQIILKKLIQC
jgi:hypothetical protein